MEGTMLEKIVSEKGITKTWLSNKTGIYYRRLCLIIAGKADLTVEEAKSISSALSLNDKQKKALFF